MKKNKKAILMNIKDNVAIALTNISSEDSVKIIYGNKTIKTVIAINDIEIYHKIALKSIHRNETIFKYGEIIGKAQKEINIGEHVHVHNIEGILTINEN
ncbi:UxaA family hydrolase [Pectinatus frisingensis]|uniref:UxaA family hydrolase n=1 Tax=Pectinatus frisingensis TaxID=865 RepID=UPI003D8028CE